MDVVTRAHEQKHEWPIVQSWTVIDPHLERDATLSALEEAWRTGLLVENEPTA
jgi:hypothetical protein